jgi:hypothetical protein
MNTTFEQQFGRINGRWPTIPAATRGCAIIASGRVNRQSPLDTSAQFVTDGFGFDAASTTWAYLLLLRGPCLCARLDVRRAEAFPK